MDFQRRRSGLGRAQVIVVIILLALVAVGAYAVIGLKGPAVTGGDQRSTSSKVSQTATSSGVQGEEGGIAILNLFGNFTKMGIQYVFDNGDAGTVSGNLTYSVLGHKTLNSSTYTVVEFTKYPGGVVTTLWFDKQGNVTYAYVKGGGNFSGGLAGLYSGYLASPFLYALTENNDSRLAGMQKAGTDSVQNVGGTQMTVSTFEVVPSKSVFSAGTIKIGVVPGATIRLLILVNETSADPEGGGAYYQVNALAKG